MHQTPTTDGAAARAYRALKAMAMTFAFEPGARLAEEPLARELKVSRTPLREALHRLASEQLVVAIPGKGFAARRLDLEEVVDLYEMRLALETFIARTATERATTEQLDALDAYVDASVAVQSTAPVEELVALDEGFHRRLAKLSSNAELVRLLDNLHARIHFFRWADMQGRRDRTQAEHRSVVRACRARDAGEAARRMQRHILHRRDEIADVLKRGHASLFMGEGPAARLDLAQPEA
ncbi:MAG: GntR family transcriptional regulator [Geminicoccaceae bacterium]|nr:MAG: GntR family transcriptional regulator [Geminicoccaceae bacterium]